MTIDRRHLTGPFDIIGDVHGCASELQELLTKLGYRIDWQTISSSSERTARIIAPSNRRAVFVGDLVDRGPSSPDVLRIVMALVTSGQGLCVPGNHDMKFYRYLQGKNVKPAHGLDLTIAQMQAEPPAFHAAVKTFLNSLVSHFWLDAGRLVVAHAGIKDDMIGLQSGAITAFCLYGDTTGETDALGLPIRRNWAAAYRGKATIIYGHTPVRTPTWENNTLCIDTGCVFGHQLTALRYPERDLVHVPARETYAPRAF